ncbi:hypothetical protein [Cytobacillus praedii]|uniref:hypothetical protein n=1 Tax=Cytobacillus praedii TaxID=1742358 RepID=UPI002E201061|nr:hypothetical protein [Cytobacillus praedii]
MFARWKINRTIRKLKKETDKEGKVIAKQLKMRKFVITNGFVQEKFTDIFNVSFDSESKRIYIHQIPLTSGEFIIKELLQISEDVVAIQVEFDQYLNGYNIEFEIYLKQNFAENIVPLVFKTQRVPGEVKVSERYYFDLLSQFERNAN